MNFTSSISRLPIAEAFVKRLNKLGIRTVADLLFHFPAKYEDRSAVVRIKDLSTTEARCTQGIIQSIESSRSLRKRMAITEAIVSDDTGSVRVTWFNQAYIGKQLKKGDMLSLVGKLSRGKDGPYLSSPSYEKIGKKRGSVHTGRIVPVYPETYGATSRLIRWLVSFALEHFDGKVPETLPGTLIKENKLLSYEEALRAIHFPKSLAEAERAKKRFQFEHIFLVQLFVLREKLRIKQEHAIEIPIREAMLTRFTKSLPFTLTDAQKKTSWQILKDLEKAHPMNRLLEGDVGSGKTVVAAIASLNTVKAGYQVAFMAPTEILAKQHFQEVAQLLETFRVDVALLTGKEDKYISQKLPKQHIEVSRTKLLKMANDGKFDIVIGTHALIQKSVRFNNLALVIVDEQHRFGVEQRAKLIKEGAAANRQIPHLLSMTATPIPRTLALTIYGDLDLSLLDEMPKGRKKIKTEVVPQKNRPKVYDFVREQVKEGRQIFVICPRIEKKDAADDTMPMKTVEEEHELLSEKVFPDLKVGMLHGKMSSKEKERAMQDFKLKKYDILVATSVIEVGIDVPNATVMLIEGADRFGLAQLHQFRGRVGRSSHQSYCFLFADSPKTKTRDRLKALIDSETSFELAEKDLEIRGPGSFFGTQQWGMPDLAMAGLSDQKLAQETRQAAKNILEKDPELKKHTDLAVRLKKFTKKVHLE